MDVPITKPSMVSYADELDFAQLLENLLKDRHNGFMRITSGEDEGYILFKNGKQVAAEYGRFSKSEAVENITSAVENKDTVVEIFDLRSSHIDYLIDVNKPFLMEPDYDVYKIIDELKGANNKEPLIPEKILKPTNTDSITKSEPVKEPEPTISEPVSKPEPEKDNTISKPEPTPEPVSKPEPDTDTSISEADVPELSEADVPESDQSKSVPEPGTDLKPEPETDTVEPEVSEVDVAEPVLEPDKSSNASEETIAVQNGQETRESEVSPDPEKISEVEKTPVQPDVEDESTVESPQSKQVLKEELKTLESRSESQIEPDKEVKAETIDRSKLMEKYGIKEMNEDDVDGLLDSYKGGSLNDDDVEKIELSLMNKIKKSIFGIPKIKGAEVMVFLENTAELTGDINIIIEYEAKGFFSRLMGESKDIDNLRRQVINIVQIEIKKSFRKYPEIVNNFNINVEIS